MLRIYSVRASTAGGSAVRRRRSFSERRARAPSVADRVRRHLGRPDGLRPRQGHLRAGAAARPQTRPRAPATDVGTSGNMRTAFVASILNFAAI